MIKVEGYKAFRGVMCITPLVSYLLPFEITGDWLYKPETKCWYGHGRSFSEEICTIIEEDPL